MHAEPITLKQALKNGIDLCLRGSPLDATYNASLGAPKAFLKNTLELVQAQALPGFLGQMFLPPAVFVWLESHLGSALPGVMGGTNYLAAGVLEAVLKNAHFNMIKKLKQAFNIDNETAVLLSEGEFIVKENSQLYKKGDLEQGDMLLKNRDGDPVTLEFLVEKFKVLPGQKDQGLTHDVIALLKGDRANFEKLFANKLSMNPTYGPILLNGMMRMGVAVGSSYLLTPVLTAAISNAAIAGFAANMVSQVASAVAVNVLRVISTATQAGAKPVVVAEDQERLLVVSERNAEPVIPIPEGPQLPGFGIEPHPLPHDTNSEAARSFAPQGAFFAAQPSLVDLFAAETPAEPAGKAMPPVRASADLISFDASL